MNREIDALLEREDIATARARAEAAKGQQLLVMAAGQEQALHALDIRADAMRDEMREQFRQSEERKQIANDLHEIKQRLK